MTIAATPTIAVEPATAPRPAAPRSRGGLWVRVGLAVLLLTASAAGRSWQAMRVDQQLRDGRKPPFALNDLPMTMGPWEGHDDVVDEQIIRITGSTDSIFRTYQHQVTGQRVGLLVLFGPAIMMYGHTPERCYPSAGFDQLSGPRARTVEADGKSWPFRELVYAKGEGGQSEVQEVYYSWKYSGKWTPNPATHKEFRRIPGMFKVQAVRGIRNEKELEMLDDGNPCEALLAQLMPDLEGRIAAAKTTASASSSSALATP